MDHISYPKGTKETALEKAKLAPEQLAAWKEFSATVFQKGVLDHKTKELIAIAVAHVTQCPWCIEAHAPKAMEAGASKEEIMEAIWVAAELRAGAAYAHSNIALQAMKGNEQNKPG